MTEDRLGQARPHKELIEEILNPCVPKNEREHAAAREIENLRDQLNTETAFKSFSQRVSANVKAWLGYAP